MLYKSLHIFITQIVNTRYLKMYFPEMWMWRCVIYCNVMWRCIIVFTVSELQSIQTQVMLFCRL